jgi:hypothetical protein
MDSIFNLIKHSMLNFSFKNWVLVLFLICSSCFSSILSVPVQAQVVYSANDINDDHLLVGEELAVLKDSGSLYSIQEVSSPEFQSKFIANTKKIPDITDVKASYWIRFSIKSVAEHKRAWVLENMDPHIDKFEFYAGAPDYNFTGQLVGYALPFKIRPYLHKNFVFDLPLDTAPKIFYVHASSRSHNPFLFKIRSQNFFTYYALNEYYLLGIFYGIVIIMAIYNLLIYFSVREEMYLYYVMYVLACGLISFGEDGTGFQYLWPEHPRLNTLIATISPLLLLVSFSVYSKVFLDLKKNLPKVNRLLDGIIVLFIAFFLIDVLFLHLKLNFPFYFIPFSVIYVAAFMCLKKGFKAARYYIVGYSFMFMSILFLFIRMSGYVHWSDIFTVYSFNIGIVFEIVILSFSLGDRIKLIKQEREAALEKLIVHLRESDRLKDSINQQLENKVKERTSDLRETNAKLEEGLKQLEFQADEIKRMNQLLNIENTSLQVNVKELTKARVLMQEVDFSEFSKIFPDKDSCYKYLSELKWKNGYKCKKCEHVKFCDGKDIYSRRCTRCRYDESATAYTIFHRLKFPVTKAFYMLFLVYANKEKITSLELSQILSLRQSTCWSFNNKIVEAMKLRKKGSGGAEADGWSLLVLDPNSEL